MWYSSPSWEKKPDTWLGNRAAAMGTTFMFLRRAAGMAPPSEATTLPRGSVTRKIALALEIFDHSSLAVSRMVAWSPVPNARRPSGSVLRMLLTEDSNSARDFHNDV